MAPAAAKFGKQIRFAERRGIPFVWFPGEPDTVKDIRSGDQVEADAATWEPPAADAPRRSRLSSGAWAAYARPGARMTSQRVIRCRR